MKTKRHWIKERHNPQLGVYFVACGQITETSAARQGRAKYGMNIMHPFNTEAEYRERIAQLRKEGELVQLL